MTLDEFVSFFGDLSRELNNIREKEWAKHLYIGLALDLDGVTTARSAMKKKSNPTFKAFEYCGPNVPPEFEKRLEDKLVRRKVPKKRNVAGFNRMLDLLLEVVREFLEDHNKTQKEKEPLCCTPYNGPKNLSKLPEGMLLCRYISLKTFEDHMLVKGRRRRPRSTSVHAARDKKEFYKKERVTRFKKNPAIFFLDKGQPVCVEFGRPITGIRGLSMRCPVFFTPLEEAPHRVTSAPKNANHVAEQMGLPGNLKWDDYQAREQDGVVAMCFVPDSNDRFFRPTILDALDHFAFRPGPAADDSGFRYGLTRVCKMQSLCWEDPVLTDEEGRKEVIMKNRETLFPTDNFYPEEVLFFQ